MAERAGVQYSGARPGDALSAFSHQTIRTTYVPRSLFSFGLTLEKGLELQDAGALGFLSSMGTPALGETGALVIDWRVIAAANPRAPLSQAADLLNDNAAKVGARLSAIAVVSSSRGTAGAAADRQATAAGASSSVPTIGGAVAGAAGAAAGAAGGFVTSALWWIVLFVVLALVGLYLVRDTLPAVARAVAR